MFTMSIWSIIRHVDWWMTLWVSVSCRTPWTFHQTRWGFCGSTIMRRSGSWSAIRWVTWLRNDTFYCICTLKNKRMRCRSDQWEVQCFALYFHCRWNLLATWSLSVWSSPVSPPKAQRCRLDQLATVGVNVSVTCPGCTLSLALASASTHTDMQYR